MKFQIKAGAEIDLLTEKELRGALTDIHQAWVTEVARGDRYRRFATKATTNGIGQVTFGADNSDAEHIGPNDGYVWALSRLAVVQPDGIGANGDYVVYLNEVSPSTVVIPGLEFGFHAFQSTEAVLYSGDSLIVTGVNADANLSLTLTGQARELPQPLAWRLGD